MSTSRDQAPRARRNVLTLDGGGVRGLSSLLILKELMSRINAEIQEEARDGKTYGQVEPHDIFDLVTGTSTGGLIAIMLGKLGMSLEECISTYYNLSKTIFGKKHLRGIMTHGLAPTKYSGRCLERAIQKVIQSKKKDVGIPMVSSENNDSISCAVICREHFSQSRYSNLKPDPISICSHSCDEKFACLVSEAARATSAAPTFFPGQRIGSRYFVDGGMEYNNPSHATFHHYTEFNRAAMSRPGTVTPEAQSVNALHGDLDLSFVRFVNLGTGTRSTDLEFRQRNRLAQLTPGFIRMALFLKKTLTEFAVNAERVAEAMRTIARVSNTQYGFNVKYERFSADNGVCYFKMDEYKSLGQIEKLAKDYLAKDEIKEQLKRVAKEIAGDYFQRHRGRPALNATSSARLSVSHNTAASPLASSSEAMDTSEPSVETTSASTSTTYNGLDPLESGTRKVINNPNQSDDSYFGSIAT